MKVHRIVFCLNSSPIYSGMWDVVSEVYCKTTLLIPTLLFFGTKEELEKEVKSDYGEVYLFPKFEEFIANPTLDWSVTWSVHWAMANKFSEDICSFSGIDEIPLSTVLWDKIKAIDESKLVIGLGANPYGSNNLIASGHNFAKGSTYKKIFDIKDDLYEELKRIWDLKEKLPRANIIGGVWWGLDEDYISTKVYNNSDVHFLDQDWINTNLQSKKICRSSGFNYCPEKLKNGFYWTAHMVRPLSDQNNKDLIYKLLKDLKIK